jgi:hypothetical protein
MLWQVSFLASLGTNPARISILCQTGLCGSDKNAIDAIADRRPLMASTFASDTMRQIAHAR